MKYLIIALLITFSFSLHAQELDADANSVLKTVFEKSEEGDLLPELGGLRFLWIKQNLGNRPFIQSANNNAHPDTLLLTSKEKSYLDGCLGTARSFKWTKAATVKAGLKMNVIMMSPERSGDQLTYAIMKPILLRNGTYCFVFYSEFTKAQGRHTLSIWKKANGKWSFWTQVAERKM